MLEENVTHEADAEDTDAVVPAELEAQDSLDEMLADLAEESEAQADTSPEASVNAESPAEAEATSDPEAEAEVTSDPEADAGPGVSNWPFVAYLALWLVFAGLVVWQLLEVPAGMAVYDAAIYPLVLIGGVSLTALGPIFILATWLLSRAPGRNSGHLFVSALFKGATATVAGAAVWWIALLVVDQLRLGSVL